MARLSLSTFSGGIAQLFGLGNDAALSRNQRLHSLHSLAVYAYIIRRSLSFGNHYGRLLPGLKSPVEDHGSFILGHLSGILRVAVNQHPFLIQLLHEPDVLLHAIYLDYIASEEYALLSEFGIEGFSFEYDENGEMVQYSDSEDSEVQMIVKTPALWVNNGIAPRVQKVDRKQEVDMTKGAGYDIGLPIAIDVILPECLQSLIQLIRGLRHLQAQLIQPSSSAGGDSAGEESSAGEEGDAGEESSGGGSGSEEASGDLKTLHILGVDHSGTDGNGQTVKLSDWVNGDSKLWERFLTNLGHGEGTEIGIAICTDDGGRYPIDIPVLQDIQPGRGSLRTWRSAD